jgi:WD40 repeat protein
MLKGRTDVVFGLTFSPDGKRSLSGSVSGDLWAIIWDVESRTLLRSVAFTPDGDKW